MYILDVPRGVITLSGALTLSNCNWGINELCKWVHYGFTHSLQNDFIQKFLVRKKNNDKKTEKCDFKRDVW